MNEKTKNIITIIMGILLILFLGGYIVLAGELHEAKAYQRDVERVQEIMEEIKNNSDSWSVQEYLKEEEIKAVKSKYETKQTELSKKNNELREELKGIQEKNIEPLGLKMSSQAQ